MKVISIKLLLMTAVAIFGLVHLTAQVPITAQVPLTVTSPAFRNGEAIPKKYASRPGSKNVSPPLAWTGAPDGTAQFALILEDSDSDAFTPPRPMVHWIIYNIPGSLNAIPEALPAGKIESGTLTGAIQGVSDFDRPFRPGEPLGNRRDASNSWPNGSASPFWAPRDGPAMPSYLGSPKIVSEAIPASISRYRGPLSRPDRTPHRYTFTVYAIDAAPVLSIYVDGLDKPMLLEAIRDHILGEGRLTVLP